MRVLLVINSDREDARNAAQTITDYLQSQNIAVSWVGTAAQEKPCVVTTSPFDLCIALGGDGTLLKAAHLVNNTLTPILGLSFGHLGFLSCASKDNYIQTVSRALAGELHLTRRTTLEVTLHSDDVCGRQTQKSYFALNEVALNRGCLGSMVEFSVGVSGTKIDTIRGDGFIVATATGSTGYALSAGGPFVTPEFSGMVCVPLAPHTILARAFLTAPSDVVELSICPERWEDRSITIDGIVIPNSKQIHRITVARGPQDILLYTQNSSHFYDSVARVFWGKGDSDND